MSDLKPCPFCGAGPERLDVSNERVYCRDCEAHGPDVRQGETAREVWNRRTAPPSPAGGEQVGEVERLRAALKPFADAAEQLIHPVSETPLCVRIGNSHHLTFLQVGDLRTALAALRTAPGREDNTPRCPVCHHAPHDVMCLDEADPYCDCAFVSEARDG